ncbi:MAG: zinc ribbon domain-containing protein [Candidatus Lokiarchaeota archaeon]
MSYMHQNFERKTLIYISLALCIILIPTLVMTFLFSISVFIIFLIISLIVMIIIPVMFSRYFWINKKQCPRCKAPVSDYDEYCKNCGLQLLSKCPKCGKLMKFEDVKCRSCGYSRKKMVIPENSQQNLRYCEFCGSKLN